MPRFVDGRAAIVINDSFAPLLISTSFGATTEKLTRETFDWLHQFAAGVRKRGEHYVTVIDARQADRPPAVVRNLISMLTDELRAATPGAELGSLFIAESALVRGAITAIIWVSRSSWQPILVRSCEEAFAKGAELLRQKGVAVRIPTNYQPPAPPF